MDYRFDLKAIELISSRDLLRKWTTLKQEENTRHVEESSYNSTYSLHFACSKYLLVYPSVKNHDGAMVDHAQW